MPDDESQEWFVTVATADEIEEGARAMYGKHWDGPPEKSPGEKMKDVWRGYARLAIEAVDAKRAAHGQSARE